jgi:hypothetical protein
VPTRLALPALANDAVLVAALLVNPMAFVISWMSRIKLIVEITSSQKKKVLKYSLRAITEMIISMVKTKIRVECYLKE